jgi:hypothetical protein
MLAFVYLEYLCIIIEGAQSKRLKSYHKINVCFTTSLTEQVGSAVTL